MLRLKLNHVSKRGHWSLPSHNWTVWNSRSIGRHCYCYYANQTVTTPNCSGASSLCWLGWSRGKHGNCRGHSGVKWSAHQEPAAQIPQFSEYSLFDLHGDTNNTFSWPLQMFMVTSLNGNIFRVTGLLCGEFTDHRWLPVQRPVTRSFNVFFDLCLNKRLRKQSGDLRRHRAHYDVPIM